MSVSVKELVDEILFKLNQNARNPLALTRVKVVVEVNNCLVDLAENTRLFPAKSTITLIADQATYTVPEDFVEVSCITDDLKRDLYPTTLQGLQNYSWDWQGESGEPRWYIIDFDQPNTIRFFQTPNTEWDARELDLVYYQYQPKIQYEAQELSVPMQRHKKTVVDFCLSQLYRFQMEVQNPQLADMYWNFYLQERNKWSKKSIDPPRLLILGSLGKRREAVGGPELPKNYPPLWGR